MTKLVNNALVNPPISMPGTRESEIEISMALTTKLNKLNAKMFKGRLITNRIGFKIRLTRKTVRLITINASPLSIWIESEKSVIMKMLSKIMKN
jgi:hypothetical protein